MKKVISVISSLIVTASLLAGCGASSSAPAATTATAAAETQAPGTQAAAASYSVAIVQQLDHGVLAPAERSVLPANKVVPQKMYFLSLFP